MSAPKHSTKNRVILMAVMLVLASCGVLGGAVFWAGNSLESRARSLPYHLEEARRLGLLTNIAELQTSASDSTDDALPDLQIVFSNWEGIEGDEQNRIVDLSRKCLRSRASKEEREEFIREVAPLMPYLISAAQKGECSVGEIETWRSRKVGRFWSTIREGIRFLGARAVIAGQDHDIELAEYWLSLGIALSHHLDTQPSYAATLRKCAAEAELQRVAERVCFANPQSREKLTDLLDKVQDEIGPSTSPAEALKGEPALFLLALSDPKRNGLQNVPAGEFFLDVGKAGALEIFNRHYRKMPSDAEDLDTAERVLIEMDKEATDTALYGNYVRGYDAMMPLMRDTLARRRLAQAAIQYFSTGKVDDLPIDPYSGKSFLTTRRDGMLVIYSVGRDGQDDRGKEREYGPNASLYYDILFRFPK